MNDRIRVVQGDITQLKVDAIVNAANRALLGGGGVDGAIHRAAGPNLLAACHALAEVERGVRCPTGESRITPGFQLAATHVIHTVGPYWCGGQNEEAESLAGCYRSALELARAQQVETIAFPAISCGVYGYPPLEAAQVATTTISDFLAQHELPREVTLVAFSAMMGDLLQQAVESLSQE